MCRPPPDRSLIANIVVVPHGDIVIGPHRAVGVTRRSDCQCPSDSRHRECRCSRAPDCGRPWSRAARRINHILRTRPGVLGHGPSVNVGNRTIEGHAGIHAAHRPINPETPHYKQVSMNAFFSLPYKRFTSQHSGEGFSCLLREYIATATVVGSLETRPSILKHGCYVDVIPHQQSTVNTGTRRHIIGRPSSSRIRDSDRRTSHTDTRQVIGPSFRTRGPTQATSRTDFRGIYARSDLEVRCCPPQPEVHPMLIPRTVARSAPRDGLVLSPPLLATQARGTNSPCLGDSIPPRLAIPIRFLVQQSLREANKPVPVIINARLRRRRCRRHAAKTASTVTSSPTARIWSS